ncbi:hypothetical protein JB92DRAFT_688390 [Gautieria morchelliformis]|nr:hypothetical protein JB92DRAFT_688390 [Gautieria morchelliformis]
MQLSLLVLAILPLVSAQFGFFEQMFQGHPAQQQQRSGANAWAAQSEAVQCSSYICPKTLDCVDTPSACPCPNPEDIKCLVPDAQDKGSATVFCVRGEAECADIERLASR